jgi:cytochrome c peroxidase
MQEKAEIMRPRRHDSRTSRGASVALGLLGILAASACRDRRAPEGDRDAKAESSSPPAAPVSFYGYVFSRRPSFAGMMDLGRKLFFDPELSASRKMSCSTCHDPHFAYGPPNDLSTQPGGPDLQSPGVRAVPTLRYLSKVPPFAEHHFDEAVDESIDQGPTGGFTWDGRADSARDQARAPLTSPFEMANDSVESVAAKVAQGSYAAEFRQTFGDDVFSDPKRASGAILIALEAFEESPRDFYPYDSRYDAWLRGQVEATPREKRGIALFSAKNKGNCASCHPNAIRKGEFPQFTDFGYNAIGVPRNPAIAANKDPAFHDMGLCGPLRKDLAAHAEYCGQFRVPTLRNIALKRVFFHNGVFHSLEDVLAFYVTRDTNPGKWYSRTGGHVEAFDDLPPQYRVNVNREPPFGGKPGAPAALTGTEIEDVIAFLKMLTDADLVAK